MIDTVGSIGVEAFLSFEPVYRHQFFSLETLQFLVHLNPLEFLFSFKMKLLFKKIFAIEGNIGAGKSTLLNKLEKSIPNVYVIPEPVTEWKNVGGEDLLAKFYEDPKRWAYAFELNSMVTKVRKMKEALMSDADVILMERSIFSDRCFQRVSFFYDRLTVLEVALLDEFYKDFSKDYPVFNGVIYLDTDVKTCMERIKKRARKEEEKITPEYLTKLEDQFMTTKYGCPMVLVDGQYDENNAEKTIQMVMKFINKCV